MLGVAGGAWAWRGQLTGLIGAPTPVASATDTPTAPPPTPASAHDVVASVAPGEVAEQSASTSAAAPAAADTPPGAAPDALAAAAASADGRVDAAAISASADAALAGTDAPVARAAQADLQALHDLPAAQAAADASGAAPPLQVAKASAAPKPAAPPKPRVPTIAVVVAGDEAIATPAQDAVTNLLQARGFRVIEGGHSRGSQPNLGALAGKADAVVFVNARPVGSQDMQYYGQSSTLYTVQLGVKAYRVSDRSLLWTGGAEQVSFTTLNAAEKAREAIGPMLDQIDDRLGEFRARGKRG